MIIHVNTIIRDGLSKKLKKNFNADVSKFNTKGATIYLNAYRKRLNSCIRKRLNSTLSYNSIKVDECAELLGLLEERLSLDNISLDKVIEAKKSLEEKYGCYDKRQNVNEEIDIPDDDEYEFMKTYASPYITKKIRESSTILSNDNNIS